MATTKTTILVELDNVTTVPVTLERPDPPLRNLETARICLFSHTVAVANYVRALPSDAYTRLTELTELQQWAQLALTQNRHLAYIGEEQVGRPWVHRRPLGDDTMLRILNFGGVTSIRKLVDAWLGLF